MPLRLRLRLVIDSTFEEVSLVGCAIHAVARQTGLSDEAAQEMELAAVEALNNVVEHAHRDRPDLPIEITVEMQTDLVTVEIVDRGAATTAERFALPDAVDPDLSDLGALEEGGRGIMLMQQLLDEISYVPEAGRNRLRLTKRVVPAD